MGGLVYSMGYISNLISGFEGNMWTWVGSIAVIAGLIMMIAGIVKIAKGLMSHGQGQVNWVVNILLLVVGGIMVFGGFGAISGFANNIGRDLLNGAV